MKTKKTNRRKFLGNGAKSGTTGVARVGLIGSQPSTIHVADELQIKKVILNRKMEGLKKEQFGGMVRSVLFSPTETGNNFLKLAYINLPPGSKGAAHIHLGEEVVFTIQGECILRIEGKDHRLEEGSAFIIPPDVEHPAEVIGEKNWIAVAAYCDECPVLKRARKKESVNYPINR